MVAAAGMCFPKIIQCKCCITTKEDTGEHKVINFNGEHFHELTRSDKLYNMKSISASVNNEMKILHCIIILSKKKF